MHPLDVAGVFISYRRSDSDVAAGRLADDLSDIFGRNAVFRDIDTLDVGEDYKDALARALDSCVALIAVIGPSWSTITDEHGRRRLDDPDDWVRREIGEALRRGIRVIPVALATELPREDEVPPDLRPLLSRQAIQMTDLHWRQDIELLAESLENVPGLARRRTASPTFVLKRPRPRALLAIAAMLLILVVGWFGWSALKHDGGVSDLSGQTSWASQANTICARTNDAINSLPKPTSSDVNGSLALGQSALHNNERMVRELAALTPPVGEETHVRQFLRLAAEMNDTTGNLLVDLQNLLAGGRDLKVVETRTARLSRLGNQFNQSAIALGATTCAEGSSAIPLLPAVRPTGK